LAGFIFSGALLGLLPMWNSAVFIAAAAVLGVLFVLFPLRGQMLVLAIVAGVLALPQMLYLSTGSGRAHLPKLLHWGYTIDQPTAANVTKYLAYTFGFKWVLIVLALIFARSLQRRFFLATLSLVAVAFCFQFTIEVLANQKFLHIWVIIANLFVAFALWRLWHLSLGGITLPGKFAASVLFLLIIPGGFIDFFPIHNTGWSEVTYKNDPLIDWTRSVHCLDQNVRLFWIELRIPVVDRGDIVTALTKSGRRERRLPLTKLNAAKSLSAVLEQHSPGRQRRTYHTPLDGPCEGD